MDKHNKPHSFHVFSFPFAWDYVSAKHDKATATFESRTDLEKFNSLLDDAIWQPLDFTSDPVNYYNDFAFFHTAAREAVFGKKDGQKQVVRNYERMGAKGGSYEIKIKKRTETYRLELSQIRLNLYDTGIGILSFFLMNHGYPEWQQILEINDYGRRIYPQFLDTPSHGKGANLLEAVQNAFLAEKIFVQDGKGRTIFSEDFNYVQHLFGQGVNDPAKWSFLSEKLVQGVFGNDTFTPVRQADLPHAQIVITPILDDRMFVATWYGNDAAARDLKTHYPDTDKTDHWMQYLFVDNSGNSCQSGKMRARLLEEHTYDRWADYLTFYGISRYSLVALTEKSDFAYNHLVEHIKGRYFELAQICLAQRASCQRFSNEITNISSLDDKLMKTESDFLYREYLRFINKLYFTEVTPQEQGIELYNLLQKHMQIKEDVDFLNRELTDLYEFLNLRENAEQSKAANQFAWVATVFLPASLVAAIFGFSTINENLTFWGGTPNLHFWIPLMLTVLTILLAPRILKKLFK